MGQEAKWQRQGTRGESLRPMAQRHQKGLTREKPGGGGLRQEGVGSEGGGLADICLLTGTVS